MAIKWKSKIVIIAWVLLLTYGLSGLSVGLSKGNYYLAKDYFQTDQFETTFDRFINDLLIFELNSLTREEVKKQLTVSTEEINEHRYRYGNLNEQITNIKGQYEGKIQDALAAKNEEVAKLYTEERDQKIADITNNFTSDEHVRQKVLKEKEEKVDHYFVELERNRQEFLAYQHSFVYYLKNRKTGEIYTNLNATEETAEQKMTSKNMAFIRTYTNLTTKNDYYNFGDYGIVNPILDKNVATFEGKIAVPKTASQTNTVLNDYYYFKQNQIVYYIYSLAGIAALLLSLFFYKNTAIIRTLRFEKLQPYYNKVPIDVKIVAFLFTCLLAFLFLNESWFFSYWESMYSLLKVIFYYLFWSTVFLSLALVQGKLLFERYKDRSNLKNDIKEAFLIKAKEAVKSAFLNRRVGTQIFIILAVVYAFGLGAIIVVMEPAFIIIYGGLFLVIGLPLLILIMKRTGYFNQIIKNTSELASGNFEPDLPIVGKSVLAKLAENINTLKYGVKASQKEQAKSERLKTELITNVSHDLRTPLTSIITYTELLKTPELSGDERDSYIEIIDRKSKRLKVLIDDLFEASKMASGNIELLKEKVDLGQLLQQALAEYDEKIAESTLQFRIATPDAPVYAIVDGQKMWRVFDNVIGNILKYALENTRVYISMKQTGEKVEISFKNIAKYELGGDVNELFERFKRGDVSRHTEGSGLGLAIAKSIVDLHGGELEMDVDGDLFKVTIMLETK
ncbi:MAG TPA: GHKL domain-containing protein [Bacillus bacterium]|nr:GHKL domain-containing protein [Bacillus sp. (in: firmicutes)]